MTALVLVFTGHAFAGGTQQEDFFKLVKSGTPDQIQAAIDRGAKVDGRDKANYGNTPLCDAAEFNMDPEVITVLLKAGAKLEERDTSEDGDTPLLLAASSNKNPAVISALLKAGADVAVQDKYGQTPLMLAAYGNENPEVVSVLLATGADINAQSKQGRYTALTGAASNSNPAVMAALLRAGANVNERTQDDVTALWYAAWKGKAPEVISLLLEAGADVLVRNKNGIIPLSLAHDNGNLVHTTAYKQLLEATQDSFRARSPAIIQIPDVLQVLLSGTAEEVRQAIRSGRLNPAKDQFKGFTALMQAAMKNPNPHVVTALIAGGAGVNEQNRFNVTALATSVENANPDIISELLLDGANVTLKNNHGLTAAYLAREFSASDKWFQDSDGYQQLLGATIAAGGTALLAPDQAAQFDPDKRDAANLVAILGAVNNAVSTVNSALDAVSRVKGNKNLELADQLLSDAQQMASGGSPAGTPASNSTSSGVPLAPGAINNNTSNSIQGPAAAQGGPYIGRGNQTVHNLLAFPTVKPYILSWTPPAPQLPPANGQREALIAAAVLDAWGAEAEARAGRPKVAEQLAVLMHENLQNAYSLRSTTPLPSGGPGSTFTPDPISDGDLKALLDAH